jgi:hypothetical protein
MRLLNVRTLQIGTFHGEDVPSSAMSHTCGDEEILFEELNSPMSENKAGYPKIEKACGVARIDTCCI